MNRAANRNTQLFFSLGYVALFLYLFLVRPAPEQKLEGKIAVDAQPIRLASLVHNEPSEPGVIPYCPLKTQLARVVAGEPVSASSLLTRWQQTRFWVEPQQDGAVLRAEMRWQVRGGLMGKAMETLLARDAHQETLARSLRRLKAAAEQSRVERASLPPCALAN